jgi:hypothetical protein
VRAVLEKYIEVMFKKPYEDGFQSLHFTSKLLKMENLKKFT